MRAAASLSAGKQTSRFYIIAPSTHSRPLPSPSHPFSHLSLLSFASPHRPCVPVSSRTDQRQAPALRSPTCVSPIQITPLPRLSLKRKRHRAHRARRIPPPRRASQSIAEQRISHPLDGARLDSPTPACAAKPLRAPDRIPIVSGLCFAPSSSRLWLCLCLCPASTPRRPALRAVCASPLSRAPSPPSRFRSHHAVMPRSRLSLSPSRLSSSLPPRCRARVVCCMPHIKI